MHKVWMALGLRKNRAEKLPSLRNEIALRRARAVTEKQGTSALMLALKEAEIYAKAISVHIHHGQTA